MGMFTEVVHPETGQNIQIKTGDDDLDVYRVGDPVKWFVSHDYVGSYCLLDGVYGEGREIGHGPYVVIKDHHVLAVVDAEDAESVRDRFGVRDVDPYQPEFYTDMAWAKYLDRQALLLRETEEFQASIAHLTIGEQLAEHLVRPLKTSINFQEVGRQLLGKSSS